MESHVLSPTSQSKTQDPTELRSRLRQERSLRWSVWACVLSTGEATCQVEPCRLHAKEALPETFHSARDFPSPPLLFVQLFRAPFQV